MEEAEREVGGIANAIAEGRTNEFVSEEEFFQTVMRQGAFEPNWRVPISHSGGYPPAWLMGTLQIFSYRGKRFFAPI
jgi:hypothetical protein